MLRLVSAIVQKTKISVPKISKIVENCKALEILYLGRGGQKIRRGMVKILVAASSKH